MAIREGNDRGNRLIGTNLADIFEGKGGNDVLIGLGGNDNMDGDSGNDLIDAGAGNDTVQGGLGADTILGGSGNDIISGDEGNDLMNGGIGDDRFLFDSGDGDDRIVGFTAGGTIDELDLRNADFDFVSFAQVLARAHNSAAGVVIDLGAGDSVTLIGIKEAQLKATDFLL